jgi:hypothetical protein
MALDFFVKLSGHCSKAISRNFSVTQGQRTSAQGAVAQHLIQTY